MQLSGVIVRAVDAIQQVHCVPSVPPLQLGALHEGGVGTSERARTSAGLRERPEAHHSRPEQVRPGVLEALHRDISCPPVHLRRALHPGYQLPLLTKRQGGICVQLLAGFVVTGDDEVHPQGGRQGRLQAGAG